MPRKSNIVSVSVRVLLETLPLTRSCEINVWRIKLISIQGDIITNYLIMERKPEFELELTYSNERQKLTAAHSNAPFDVFV